MRTRHHRQPRLVPYRHAGSWLYLRVLGVVIDIRGMGKRERIIRKEAKYAKQVARDCDRVLDELVKYARGGKRGKLRPKYKTPVKQAFPQRDYIIDCREREE